MINFMNKYIYLFIITIIVSLAIGCIGSNNDKIAELIRISREGKSIKVRHEACSQLGDYSDSRAVDALIGFLKDDLLAYCAAESLGRIGDEKAIGPLLNIIERDDGLNRLAIWAIGEIGNHQALDNLIQLESRFVPENDSQKTDKRYLKEAIKKLSEKL